MTLLPCDASAAPKSARSSFLRDALVGLRAEPKRLSPKYFYDRTGSLLFDEICELPEYYVTRTERAILEADVESIANAIASKDRPCRVVEPGAGSGTKTRLLLEALGRDRCAGYVPVDIDGVHLAASARRLRSELPWLDVRPVTSDFTVDIGLGRSPLAGDARSVVFFPGSTIGNFDPSEAERLLAHFRRAAGKEGLILLGVDLKKDPAELHAAYNDARGVTAAFNKNVLRRMNTELGADFDLDLFHHYAFYAPNPGRIEMHLVSARKQTVAIAGERITFLEGESICTERSYKYDLEGAARLGAAAGLTLTERWLDRACRFAVLLLRPA